MTPRTVERAAVDESVRVWARESAASDVLMWMRALTTTLAGSTVMSAPSAPACNPSSRVRKAAVLKELTSPAMVNDVRSRWRYAAPGEAGVGEGGGGEGSGGEGDGGGEGGGSGTGGSHGGGGAAGGSSPAVMVATPSGQSHPS